jgi:1,4-dihydroxy-2-naphthoate octaprenyltransferase
MKAFFAFIELQTKTVSVLAFLLGTVYAAYRYGPGALDPLLGIMLFVAVLLFDMTTTAVNNHVEFRHRLSEVARGETPHAPIRDYRMGKNAQLIVILLMFAGATAAGLWVASRTDVVVLLVGALCFAVGVLYSAGPLPIARTPFGEIFSGLFMGMLIPFLAVYVHLHEQGILALSVASGVLSVTASLPDLLPILLLGVAPTAVIAGVMLANNICDQKTDLADHRYTLPVLVGTKASLRVFAGLYVASAIAIFLQAASGWVSPWILLALLPAPKVYLNVRTFFRVQDKPTTFPLSVQNLVLTMAPSILVFAVLAVMRFLS